MAVSWNRYHSKKFIDKYFEKNWAEKTSIDYDSTDYPWGLDTTFKQILYRSNSPEEAEQQIIEVCKDNLAKRPPDIKFILRGYFGVIGKTPAELEKDLSDG